MRAGESAWWALLILASCAFEWDGYDPRQASGSPNGGTGGATFSCQPGEVVPCYDGPEGTEGVGQCRAGLATCQSDGSGFGTCEGATRPEPERCETAEDEDCDGSPLGGEAGCACLPGALGPCYEGPANTLGIGICRAGTGLCNDAGTAVIGACLGQTLPVGETCASELDEDCNGVANDWCGSWHKRFGRASVQRPDAVDVRGNRIALAGHFGVESTSTSLTTDLGGPDLVSEGLVDGLVGVFSAIDGAHLWSRRFGGSGNDRMTAIAFDEAGDVYAAGWYSGQMLLDGQSVSATNPNDSDAFIVKLDGASGATQWVHHLTGSGTATPRGIAVANGQVVVVGSFEGTMGVAPGESVSAVDQADAFVVALDAQNGSPAWHFEHGGLYADHAHSVDIAPNGDVLVGGEWDEPQSVGPFPLPDASSQGGYLLLLEGGGTPIWVFGFDGSGDDGVYRARFGADGHIYATGRVGNGANFGGGAVTANGTDAFVASFTTAPALRFSHVLEVPLSQEGYDVDVDNDGNVVIGVSLSGHALIEGLSYPGSANDTWLVLWYDPAGMLQQARMFGDHGDQDIVATRFYDGGIILAGECIGEMSFGNGLTSYNSGESICLAKLQP